MLTPPGEETLHKEALAVGDQDNGTFGKDSLDKGTLAVAVDLGKNALDKVAEADRLLPCMVLFLVTFSFSNFY